MKRAQKLHVGRTRNRTRSVSSLVATYLEVCKTFIRRFDPAPRLQSYSGASFEAGALKSAVRSICL
jgi:hypothetical protein